MRLRHIYARRIYASLFVTAMLFTAACASSPAHTEPTASQKALLSVVAAQQYAAQVGQAAGRLHAKALLTDSELAEVVEAGTALDTAWRAAALSIAQDDPQPVVDERVGLMQAAKLRLQVVWAKYEGRGK